MFEIKDDTDDLYRDKIGVSLHEERQMTKNLFKIGSVAVYLEKKIPTMLNKMKKELSPSELGTLKSAMIVAKNYRVTLQAILKDIENEGLKPESMQALVDYIKKGLKFIEKAKKKLGAERFKKLTNDIIEHQRKSRIVDKAGFSYQRINQLIHSEDYRRRNKGESADAAKQAPTKGRIIPATSAPNFVTNRLSDPLELFTLQRGINKDVSFRIPTTTKIVPLKQLPQYVDRLTAKEYKGLKQAYDLLT